MSNCIFCRIAQRQAPAHIVYEDEWAVAFHDIHPRAPVHILIIPRRHIANLQGVSEQDEALAGHLLTVANRVAQDAGVAESGFRVVVNVNRDAGQSVDHLHLHLLGGRLMRWPPG